MDSRRGEELRGALCEREASEALKKLAARPVPGKCVKLAAVADIQERG